MTAGDPFTGNTIHVVHEEVTVVAGSLDVAGIRVRAGETLVLPSWERGQACRRRYEDLVTSHGLLKR